MHALINTSKIKYDKEDRIITCHFIEVYNSTRPRANYFAGWYYTFSTLFKKWWEKNETTLSIHRKKYITGTVKRYFLPYFGKKPINAINDTFVENYWDWRINYWNSVEGLEKIGKAQKSRTTKNKPYKNVLGNVAKVAKAKERGVYLGRKPSIDVEMVKELKAEGMGATAIARELEIDRTNVYRVLRWSHFIGQFGSEVKVYSCF